MGEVGAGLAGTVAFGISILLLGRVGDCALLRYNFRRAVKSINQSQCPHHLHGRLKVYNRPLRRVFRRNVFQICAGCGKRSGDIWPFG